MSTCSAIARANGDGWDGVYVHFDGYPTSAGEAWWRLLQEQFKGDAGAFLTFAVDEHPEGWSSVPEPSTHDAAPTCYRHRDGDREDMQIREHGGCASSGCDPLSIEWVYVFSPTHLTVLAAVEYKHVPVGVVPLAGPEPDWAKLEACDGE